MKPFIPNTLIEKYFAALSGIPRLSEYESAAADYVCAEAKRLGLKHRRDAMHNVVVWKPAASGCEAAPEVMLQAHLDMVGVSAPGVAHDFTRDPLVLGVEGEDRLRAEGTTLGADDGYGCAYMLAAMAEEFPHPALTLVFTAQEENGCHGAKALEGADISARRMIGLDVMGSDIEYTSTVSGYCSDRLIVSRACGVAATSGAGLRLVVSGVRPVYTGAMVHPEQGSAIKIVARLLMGLAEAGVAFRLAELSGGVAENYSAVRCEALLAVDAADQVEAVLRGEFARIEAELRDGAQELALTLAPEACAEAVGAVETRALVELMYLMPSGTQEISPADQRMIATNNLGVVALRAGEFSLRMSDRAQDPGCKDGVNRRVAALARLYHCALRVEKRYEPWPYMADSPLRRAAAALMREVYGHDMEENICPGGLEISDLLPKLPGLDCVMFAPIGGGCHTPDEWMSLASFARVYAFLKRLLGELAATPDGEVSA